MPETEQQKLIRENAARVAQAWADNAPAKAGDLRELRAELEALTERVAKLERVVRPKGLFG